LKKKPGIFRKCPAFSKDARLFNHTGYTQYVLKKPGLFHRLKRLHCCDCYIFVALWAYLLVKEVKICRPLFFSLVWQWSAVSVRLLASLQLYKTVKPV
jgi:hypothetical protein